MRTDRLARMEAVLFLSRESLNSRKLSEYADLQDGTEARTLVRQLNHIYQEEQSVLRVERVAGGYQLVTHWQFGRWLKRLGADQSASRMSAPSMETLAVVAYRQPVLRAEVEAIRGVSCGEMLRQLMERDLVRIRGRSEELGRPYLYGTTKRFLQRFGLDSIEELLTTDIFGENTVMNSDHVGSEGEVMEEEEFKDDERVEEVEEEGDDAEYLDEGNDEEGYEEDDEAYDGEESDEEYLEEDEEDWEDDDWEEVTADEDEAAEEDEDEEGWADAIDEDGTEEEDEEDDAEGEEEEGDDEEWEDEDEDDVEGEEEEGDDEEWEDEDEDDVEGEEEEGDDEEWEDDEA
ncbi:MAG: SMC-Scp complex subunit ScpB [Planctomycetota bacterium]|nr:SMC-Scp complex subunit ScpB [Planctomycetota bacterium]